MSRGFVIIGFKISAETQERHSRTQEKHSRPQEKHRQEKHRRTQKNAEDTATITSAESHRPAAHAA